MLLAIFAPMFVKTAIQGMRQVAKYINFIRLKVTRLCRQ